MRRVLTLLASLALATVVVAGTAGAANAAPAAAWSLNGHVAPATVTPAAAPAGCTSGNLCFWRDNNTSGGTNGPGQLSGKNANWAVFSHPSCAGGTWNNCASYAYNHGVSCAAVMYDLTSYNANGDWLIINRNVGVDLAAIGFNDEASSNDWVDPNTFLATSTCSGPSPV